MEQKFCGKCGKPLTQCTCNGAAGTDFGSTHFEQGNARRDTGNRGSGYYEKHFDNIALAEGEVVVRQYKIGQMRKRLFKQGNGGASIVITNKRVISKSDSDIAGLLTTTSVEEIGLDNVAGVKNYYSLGFSIPMILLTLICFSAAMSQLDSLFSKYAEFKNFLLAVVFLAGTVYAAFNCRKPSYLFSVYASTTSQALVQGSNMVGKLIDRYSTGIVFRYKPTTEAVKMMCEMGACIMDLKNKGDYAIDAWKQEK